MKDQSKDYKVKAQIIKNNKVEEVELKVVEDGDVVFFYKKNILLEIRSRKELKDICKSDVECNSNINILVNTVELYSIIQ